MSIYCLACCKSLEAYRNMIFFLFLEKIIWSAFLAYCWWNNIWGFVWEVTRLFDISWFAKNPRRENTHTHKKNRESRSCNRKKNGSTGPQMYWLVCRKPFSMEDVSLRGSTLQDLQIILLKLIFFMINDPLAPKWSCPIGKIPIRWAFWYNQINCHKVPYYRSPNYVIE